MGIKDKLPLIRSESRIIRLFGYVVYAFVILFIIGLLVPSPPATPEAPTPAPTSLPTVTPTTTPTSLPTPEPTPEPIALSGRGQEATLKFSLEKGLSIFRMTHDGDSNFIVRLLDDEGDRVDLFVNEIGEFDGSKAIGISKGGIYLLSISADGNWAISIE